MRAFFQAYSFQRSRPNYQTGASLVEYAFLIALVSLVVAAALLKFSATARRNNYYNACAISNKPLDDCKTWTDLCVDDNNETACAQIQP